MGDVQQLVAAIQPVFLEFWQLEAAMHPLHLGNPALVDRLHDVWKLGAPSPDSFNFEPAHFDERKPSEQGRVRRLILPTALAAWIVEVSAARGFPYTPRQALNLVEGRADYGY